MSLLDEVILLGIGFVLGIIFLSVFVGYRSVKILQEFLDEIRYKK